MSGLAAAVSSMLVHPGYFFPWRQMNTSLACQERALGKLVPAEALGRGLDMRRAMDLVCRGWKNNLTLAQPLDYIIGCKHKNIPGTPVKYPTTRKGLVICVYVSFCFGHMSI